MINRELATMQIANDVIRIVDRTVEVEDTVLNQEKSRIEMRNPDDPQWSIIQRRKDFVQRPDSNWVRQFSGYVIVAEWWAMAGEEPVAHGFMLRTTTPNVAALYVEVADGLRHQGIGKLMTRCGMDLAIYHRVRTVLCGVLSGNEAAEWILQSEDFENVIEKMADGFVLYRKELNWQS